MVHTFAVSNDSRTILQSSRSTGIQKTAKLELCQGSLFTLHSTTHTSVTMTPKHKLEESVKKSKTFKNFP